MKKRQPSPKFEVGGISSKDSFKILEILGSKNVSKTEGVVNTRTKDGEEEYING